LDRLIVICEGGAHTVEYLHNNGIYPGAVVLEPSKFQEMVPYLSSEDEILLIIKGLTDFTMTDIYSLLSKFDEHKDKVKSVTVLSNIKLGVIPYEYYYYQNDLFYGDVWKIVDNKQYEIGETGEIVVSKKLLPTRKSKTQVNKEKKNQIMFAFKRYKNFKGLKMQIYGKMERLKPEEFDVNVINAITVVDLFQENKNL
jgi:hypothetical protein